MVSLTIIRTFYCVYQIHQSGAISQRTRKQEIGGQTEGKEKKGGWKGKKMCVCAFLPGPQTTDGDSLMWWLSGSELPTFEWGSGGGCLYTQENPFFTQQSHLACPSTTFPSAPEGLTSSWRDDCSLRWKESQEPGKGLTWQAEYQNSWDKGTRSGTGKAPLFPVAIGRSMRYSHSS